MGSDRDLISAGGHILYRKIDYLKIKSNNRLAQHIILQEGGGGVVWGGALLPESVEISTGVGLIVDTALGSLALNSGGWVGLNLCP